MRLIVIILFLGFFQTIAVYSQTTDFDTVFVKRSIGNDAFEIDTLFITAGQSTDQVLTGTTFLPYSDKMIGLLNIRTGTY
ncbi:MAG: hypothetical protein ACI8ZM_002253 [Crocinitomix sp.]|jgi:hypothetical protein